MRRAMISPAVARRRRRIVVLLVLVATFGRVSVVDSSLPRSSSGSIVASSSSSSSSSQSSSPSSAGGCDDDGRRHLRGRPAWNASPKINGQGYLCELYRRIPGEWEESSSSSSSAEEEEGGGGGGCPPHPHPPNPRRRRPPRGEAVDLDEPVIVRQVPGDGCCLFHAVAVSLNLIHGRHLRMDDANSLGELKVMSRSLRRTAVGCLRSSCGGNNRNGGDRRRHRRENGILPTWKKKYSRLFIQGGESMSTSHLLSTAAAQYGISPEEYCDLMEQDSYWGGGPEIVALCNVLERPIHVYELVGSSGGGGGGNVDGRPRGARSVVAFSPPSEESDDGGWPSRGGWSDDFKYGCAPPLLLDGDGMGGCDWILRDSIISSSPPGASSRCWWHPAKLLRQQHDGGCHQPDNRREEWEGGDQ